MTEIARASIGLLLDKAAFEKDVGEAGALAETSIGGSLKRATEVAKGLLPVAIFAGLVDVGEKFQGAFNTIIQKTGATGAALQGLEGDFKKIFATTPGASFSNVADAISLIYTRTGLTGKGLDDLARKEVELGKITKTDVGQNVQDTTALFNKFGIAAGQQSASLDILFKASQAGGKGIQALSSDMTRAEPILSGLGLSFAQTASLTALLEKAGVRSQSVIMGLGKEFAAAAKAGKDPIDVIHKLVNEIQKAPNATEAASIAIHALGARAGGEFVAAVRSGAFNMDALVKTLQNGKGGIDATTEATLTLGDRFKIFKNEALTALEPIAMKALELTELFVSKLPGAFSAVGRIAKNVVSLVREVFRFGESDPFGPVGAHLSTFEQIVVRVARGAVAVFNGLKEAWQSFTDGFSGGVFEGKIAGIGEVFGRIGEGVRIVIDAFRGLNDATGHSPAWIKAMQDIGDATRKVFDFLKDNAKPILIGLTVVFGLIVAPITTIVVGLALLYARFQVLRDVVRDVVIGFRTAVTFLAENVPPAFAAVVQAVQPLLNLAKPLVETFTSAFAAIYVVLKTAFEIVGGIVLAAVLILQDLWDRFGQHLIDHLKVALDAVAQVIRGALEILKGIFDLIHDVLTGKWGKLWGDIEEIAAGIWNVIYGVVRTGINTVSTIIGGAAAAISEVWGGVWAGIKGAVLSAFGGVADVLAGVFNGVIHVVTDAVNAVITAINFVIKAYDDIPGFLRPGTPTIQPLKLLGQTNVAVPSGTFGPNDPTQGAHGLAAGGIVLPRPGGTLARIAEAGRAEAILPLTDQMLAALQHLGTGSPNQPGGITTGDIYVTAPHEKRVGTDIVRELRDEAFLLGIG